MQTHLIRAAIEEELRYFNNKVLQITDMAPAFASEGFKLVRTRLIISNKGGTEITASVPG